MRQNNALQVYYDERLVKSRYLFLKKIISMGFLMFLQIAFRITGVDYC